MKIGVIGGGGWLGGAIVESLLAESVVKIDDIALSYRREQPERFAGAFWTADSQLLADRSEVVILSVRPQDWPALSVDAKGKLVISVMAGIRLDALAQNHNTRRVIRTLPNAAAEVGKSYTPWVASADATESDHAVVRKIFDACGVQDQVSSESDIDYLTGLTGSGPAFPALLAAAMMEDALARGLSREVAQRAVNTVLVGTGRLLERKDIAPRESVEAFLGYRGTTAAAIEVMRAAGFDQAVAKGLAAALEKSMLMGS